MAEPTLQNRASTSCAQAAGAVINSLFDESLAVLWMRAFDASPDLISILDTRHRIVAVNSAMALAMACTPEEARGKSCFELLHRSHRPPLACPHKAMLEDGQAQHAEIYEERLDQWLLVSVTPLLNDDGDLAGSIHIARDITDQKRTEQALRESEERFHHLSEATVEGVLLSEGLTVIATNLVLAEMLGTKPAELTGKLLTDFIAPHHRGRLHAFLRTRPSTTLELDCIRKNGTVFPIEAHTKAVSYNNAMVYQTAIRDMSQQKAMEQEHAMHERLQGVLEMAGAVCHEINQPMMALYGYMDILTTRTARGEPLDKTVDRMDRQLKRIETILQKLMHITQYKTKDYVGGEKIVDIDEAAAKSSPEKEAAK